MLAQVLFQQACTRAFMRVLRVQDFRCWGIRLCGLIVLVFGVGVEGTGFTSDPTALNSTPKNISYKLLKPYSVLTIVEFNSPEAPQTTRP